MTQHTPTYYAKRDGINPRTAQRYREKLNIGIHINSGNGVWLLTEQEWQQVRVACTDAGKEKVG